MRVLLMGILDRLLQRPPGRNAFAKMLLKRIRKSGDQRPIEYDAEKFQFRRTNSQVSFLGNIYQEYLRSDRGDREQLIRNFLAMWYTTERPVPEDFDLVKADLLPALRARSFLEIDVPLAGENDKFQPMYETIGEHLALSLAYDLPTSMMMVSEDILEKWGVTFYEAMEIAKRNLSEKPLQCAQIGPLYALANSDGYDATRMVLLDFVRQLKTSGDPVAMVPNRERLYITGADDSDGLKAMLHFVGDDVKHERFISGIAFRLEGNEWQPWLPPVENPHYQRFHELALQTIGEMYAQQATLLNRRHAKTGEDVFVATFSAVRDKATSDVRSYAMWAEGVDALLPKADDIILARPREDGISIVARCDWATLQRLTGDLMELQETYPQRWRVRQFPPPDVLQQLEQHATSD
jgi:hypothetical protein